MTARMQQPISFTSMAGDALTVLVAVTTPFIIRFVGDLPISEILILGLVFPLFVVYRKRALRSDATRLYMLFGLWLAGQMLTDVYRQTKQVDWMLGDALIVFFAIDTIFFVMLLSGNTRRKFLFLLAYGLGSIAQVRFFPVQMNIDSLWKFGYSTGVNLLLILASCIFYARKLYLPVLGLCGFAVALNLFFNFRSMVLTPLLAIALVVPVLPEYVGPWKVLPPVGSKRRLAVLVALALAVGVGAASLVKGLYLAGVFGDEARAKTEQQSKIRGGLLIGGRPEILVSSRAVMDSPILGHGSRAKDFKYIEMLVDVLSAQGMVTSLEDEESGYQGIIPSHSHLMGAWVWAGIVGAVFWGYYLALVLRAMYVLAMKPSALAPVYMFLLVTLAWDIVFSPFGSTRRLTEGMLTVVVLDLLKESGSLAGARQWLPTRTWKRHAFQGQRPIPRPTRGVSQPG